MWILQKVLLNKDCYLRIDLPGEVIDNRNMVLPIFVKALDLYPELNPKHSVDKIVQGIVHSREHSRACKSKPCLYLRVCYPIKNKCNEHLSTSHLKCKHKAGVPEYSIVEATFLICTKEECVSKVSYCFTPLSTARVISGQVPSI